MKIRHDISLKELNTFGLDVEAENYVEVFSEEDIIEAVSLLEFKDEEKLILGGGSNILLTKNFNGLVIKISIPGVKIIEENEESVLVEAGAGVIWHELVLYCVENNFGGIENLSLIPGTVGAAPIQNIGAYGQELKNVLNSVKGIYYDGSKGTFNADECNFGYRDNIFKNELRNKFIITSVILKLSKNPVLNLSYGSIKSEIAKLKLSEVTIRNISEVVCNIRKSKLPDPKVTGNAGSFFKNPEVDEKKFIDLQKEFPDIVAYRQTDGSYKIAAAWLIEKCGWKGKRIGNTGTHPKQSLVLVNYGDAKGKEILQLAEQIKKSVQINFGVTLKEEVNIY